MNGFKHPQDILRWNLGLDIVNLIENETPTRGQFRNPFFHFILNILRGTKAEEFLSIAPSAPEGQVPGVSTR